jgi:hypothetical protein
MTHAKSLRVIGQKLELARVSLFQIEHDGQSYAVQSDSMSRTAEWMLRYATSEREVSTDPRPGTNTPVEFKPVIFSNTDLTRLDSREAKRRRGLSTSEAESPIKLSHLLRALGDHLDRASARTFCIFWMPDSVVVDYKRSGGLTDRLRFTPATLGQIALEL